MIFHSPRIWWTRSSESETTSSSSRRARPPPQALRPERGTRRRCSSRPRSPRRAPRAPSRPRSRARTPSRQDPGFPARPHLSRAEPSQELVEVEGWLFVGCAREAPATTSSSRSAGYTVSSRSSGTRSSRRARRSPGRWPRRRGRCRCPPCTRSSARSRRCTAPAANTASRTVSSDPAGTKTTSLRFTSRDTGADARRPDSSSRGARRPARPHRSEAPSHLPGAGVHPPRSTFPTTRLRPARLTRSARRTRRSTCSSTPKFLLPGDTRTPSRPSRASRTATCPGPCRCTARQSPPGPRRPAARPSLGPTAGSGLDLHLANASPERGGQLLPNPRCASVARTNERKSHDIPATGNTGPPGQPRGVAFVITCPIITLGIYSLYWVYKTQEEMKQHTGDGLGGVLGLVVWIIISPSAGSSFRPRSGTCTARTGRSRR